MAMVDLPLEPIVTPAAPGAWPWGIGWWLLILAAIIILALLITAAIFARQQLWARHPANKALSAIRAEYDQQNDAWLLDRLSRFMRATAMQIQPSCRGLCDQAWLNWLDETALTHEFSQGVGRHLVDSRYAPNADLSGDGQTLIALCQRWLELCYRSAK